jgi:hypothetical protein
MRENGHPFGAPQTGTLRKAKYQKEEKGIGGKETRVKAHAKIQGLLIPFEALNDGAS